jgi:ATP-dependent protease ClpP protease subunit
MILKIALSESYLKKNKDSILKGSSGSDTVEVKENTIYLNGIVTNEMQRKFNIEINEMKEKFSKNTSIMLTSFGGSIYDGLSMRDTIINKSIPVHVDGYAMSMGFIILLASPRRSMGDSAVLMHHNGSFYVWGDVENGPGRLKNMYNLEYLCEQDMRRLGVFSEEELNKIRQSKEPYYIYKAEAIRRGIVNYDKGEFIPVDKREEFAKKYDFGEIPESLKVENKFKNII